MIFLKSPHEIEIMRAANRIVSEILVELRERVAPGVSTGDLDRIAAELIKKKGARSAFKGYRMRNGSVPRQATSLASKPKSATSWIQSGSPKGSNLASSPSVIILDVGACRKIQV